MEPLRNWTTLRTGGPAMNLARIETGQELVETVRWALTRGIPWTVIGGGSNLLVDDAGLQRLVLVFRARKSAGLQVEGDHLVASGAAPFAALAGIALDASLTGVEWAAGIPGTVGGAIRGNAGAFGHAVGERVEELTLLQPDGSTRRVTGEEMAFSYRRSALMQSNEIVLQARLRLVRSSAPEIEAGRRRVREILILRKQKHPDPRRIGTAGCLFRNPAVLPGQRPQSAGRLLEPCGAKDLSVGGARIFPRHANIVVTDSTASSSHVLTLARELQRRVEHLHQLRLEPEVVYLWEANPPPTGLF